MEPTGSLKAFIQDWIEKAHFDLSEVENHWSDQDGVLCILTAPDQWLEGRPAILDHYRAVLPGSGDYQVFVDHLEAYREGSVGWVAAQPVFALSSGGRLPVRFTAILHLEKDGWKFVQYHVSAGITEEEFVRKAQAV